jgi:hypothetical protein
MSGVASRNSGLLHCPAAISDWFELAFELLRNGLAPL